MTEKKSKRGIRFIPAAEDLSRLFGVGHPDDEEAADFSGLLERSLAGIDARGVAREKEPPESLETRRMRDLLSDYPPPQAELDLHGLSAGEAGIKTEAFLQASARQGLQTVRVIVGKGLHSPGRPVLPDAVERTVVALKRKQQVLTFGWEKRAKQQSGSLIVYLPRCGP